MILSVSQTRSGVKATVEREGEYTIMRLGNSPDVQSVLPVPSNLYYNAVRLSEKRDSILVIGVAGGSAGRVALAAGFDRIVGIEADAELLRLGDVYFGVREVFDGVALGDAFDFDDWKKVGWDRKWSCIFFDAYNESTLSRRALEPVYLRFLLSRLVEGGTLLFNCATKNNMDALRSALADIGIIGTWHKYSKNWVCEVKKT